MTSRCGDGAGNLRTRCGGGGRIGGLEPSDGEASIQHILCGWRCLRPSTGGAQYDDGGAQYDDDGGGVDDRGYRGPVVPPNISTPKS